MTKKRDNNHGNPSEYFNTEPLPFKVTEVRLSVEKAVALIFTILGVESPAKEQRAFVKAEVVNAKAHHNFKKLVVFCAGCRGVLDKYYQCRFVFTD